jgi:hypothetical protein
MELKVFTKFPDKHIPVIKMINNPVFLLRHLLNFKYIV